MKAILVLFLLTNVINSAFTQSLQEQVNWSTLGRTREELIAHFSPCQVMFDTRHEDNYVLGIKTESGSGFIYLLDLKTNLSIKEGHLEPAFKRDILMGLMRTWLCEPPMEVVANFLGLFDISTKAYNCKDAIYFFSDVVPDKKGKDTFYWWSDPY